MAKFTYSTVQDGDAAAVRDLESRLKALDSLVIEIEVRNQANMTAFTKEMNAVTEERNAVQAELRTYRTVEMTEV